jgi:hypothetical protein
VETTPQEFVRAEELRKQWTPKIKMLQREIDHLTEQYFRCIIQATEYYSKREQLIIQMIELKVMIKEREKYEQFFQKLDRDSKRRRHNDSCRRGFQW